MLILNYEYEGNKMGTPNEPFNLLLQALSLSSAPSFQQSSEGLEEEGWKIVMKRGQRRHHSACTRCTVAAALMT